MQNYTNSPLATVTMLSPNHSGQRTHDIDTITPHCFVGQVTAKRGCEVFQPTSRKASCNYVVGYDGGIGLCVEEKNRSWCSGGELNVNGVTGAMNDQRAITIETASDSVAPYTFKEAAYGSLILLCTDICKRYGKTKLIWIPNAAQAVAYEPKADEMKLTVHRWFARKSCPGDWMMEHMAELATRVTSRLQGDLSPSEPQEEPSTLYHVQIGAFKVKDNATRLLERVKGTFPDAFIKQYGEYYKVQIGAFKILDNATKMLQRAEQAGFTDAFISKE